MFRHRYDVDTGSRTELWTWPLPSATPEAVFRVEVRAVWRIGNPSEAVRRNLRLVASAERMVADATRALLRSLTAAFPVGKAGEAVDHVRAACRTPYNLDAGITVLGLSVRLAPPDAAPARPQPASAGPRPGLEVPGQHTASHGLLPPGVIDVIRRVEPDVRALRDCMAVRGNAGSPKRPVPGASTPQGSGPEDPAPQGAGPETALDDPGPEDPAPTDVTPPTYAPGNRGDSAPRGISLADRGL